MPKEQNQKIWTAVLVLTCIVLAVIMQIPQLLHQVHPLSQGRIIELNDDEPDYHARVQEALTGRPELAGEAFVGDPDLLPMHFAFIESLYGRLFGWTGWSAPVLLQVMDSIVPVLLILALFAFFRLCGFSNAKSYAGIVVFLFVSLYYLDRPINQRAPALFLMMTLISIILSLERHILFAVVAGVLLALLFDVYFWSWTFAWAWWGLLLFWEGWCWLSGRTTEEKNTHRKRFLTVIAIGCVALIAAIPFFHRLFEMMQHPLYEEGKFRAGIRSTHLPVSWPYSILFAGMSVGAIALLKKTTKHQRLPYAPIMILSGFVVLNQQIVHGMEFRTTSQYLFPQTFAAITALLLFFRSWKIKRWKPAWVTIPLLCALIFLGGKLYDNRRITRQWIVRESAFSGQHLMGSLPTLRSLPRSRIVAPVAPTNFIAGYTHHDVVYSVFLKNVLMGSEEIAERFCLSHQGFPEGRIDLSIQEPVWPDASRATGDPSVREEERRMVRDACARVAENPGKYLERFAVDYVFWDERSHPLFSPERYGEGMTKSASGSGWSLWKVRSRQTGASMR